MCHSRAVGGGSDGLEGREEVCARDPDCGRVHQQLVMGVVDLGVLPPQGMQRCFCT